MAWHRPGDKPLTEPMPHLLTHICVTRLQWVISSADKWISGLVKMHLRSKNATFFYKGKNGPTTFMVNSVVLNHFNIKWQTFHGMHASEIMIKPRALSRHLCAGHRGSQLVKLHTSSWPYDDVMKSRHFPRYWPFVWRIHRSPVNSPHKGKWRGTVFFDPHLNTWLSKQSIRRWFQTPSRSLWRHCNAERYEDAPTATYHR